MLKALLKKQFLETVSFFFLNNKDGSRRRPLAAIGFAALMLYAVGAMVALFWMMAETLCAPLVEGGLDWVYFAFLGSMATALGCVGSVFAAKSKLFEAKDNDFLLSLPLPPWTILFTRMFSLYLLTFFFEAVVLVPAIVQYFVVAGFRFFPALCSLAILFVLPLGTLAICSLLGWLIAMITARIRAKNFLTFALFIAFMAAYFVAVEKMNEYLTYVIANGEAVGETIKGALFPLWQMGLAACGDPLALLVFSAIFIGLFTLVYLLLSKTFLRVVTVKRGEKKRAYREKKAKNGSVFFALMKKEASRFFKNPMILLNSAMGSVLAIALCVIALFNLEFCNAIISSGISREEISVILTIVLCFIASSNIVTGSSVSLEGETLWILRSSPVRTTDIFKAKIGWHFLMTAIPASLCAAVLYALLKIPLLLSLLSLALVFTLILFCAIIGLAVNLKMPNLHWTNEVAAVKQSVSAMVSMFIGWGVSALLIGGHFLLSKYLPAWAYLLSASVLFSALSAAFGAWLKRKGTKIFEKL